MPTQEEQNGGFDLGDLMDGVKNEEAKPQPLTKEELKKLEKLSEKISEKEIETAKEIVKAQVSKPTKVSGDAIPSKKKTVNELLDELFERSIDERQQKILGKYKTELASFEESLGKKDFLKALGEFMMEKIEGKVLAAKSKS